MNGDLVHETHEVPSGVPGLDLIHIPSWLAQADLPVDGEWSVTLSGRNTATQRCRFRTFHAALHYALRIRDLADWTTAGKEVLEGDAGRMLSEAMRHAEAHAHEVDAVYPIGGVIPFDNGPAIIDDDGTTRQFLRGAPDIRWEKDDDGRLRCPTCGADPVVHYDWMGDE